MRHFFPNQHVTKLDFNGFWLQNGIVLWWTFSDSSQKKLNANWASNFGINAKFSPNCMFLVHSTKFCQIKAVRKRVIYWTNAFMKVRKLLYQINCYKALKSLLGFWTTYGKICQFNSGEKHVHTSKRIHNHPIFCIFAVQWHFVVLQSSLWS